MPQIKRILVPVDFSEGATAALRYASFLADTFEASIDVLHVWEPSPYITPSEIIWLSGSEDQDAFAKRMKRDLLVKLDEYLAEVLGERASAVEKYVEAGYPSHSILHRLESEPYDLAVIGTHGRTGLPHLLMGSVAERVVRTAPCPVLTIRAPAKASPSADERSSPHE